MYNNKVAPPDLSEPQQVEAWALTQAGLNLAKAKTDPVNIEVLTDAVRGNIILWTVFQDAVLDDSSPLPFEIRQNLLNLSRFIDKHSMELLADHDLSKLDILININKNIAAGLLESPSQEGDDVAIGNMGDGSRNDNDKINNLPSSVEGERNTPQSSGEHPNTSAHDIEV